MTKKRWLAVAAMLGCLWCGGCAVAMMLPPNSGVTKENFDRIENGMTRAEVELIFGRPSDGTQYFPKNPKAGTADVWSISGDSIGHARIYFDDDRVKGQYSTWVQSEPETLTQKIWSWFHLP